MEHKTSRYFLLAMLAAVVACVVCLIGLTYDLSRLIPANGYKTQLLISNQWKVVGLLITVLLGLSLLVYRIYRAQILLAKQERALLENARFSALGSLFGSMSVEFVQPVDKLQGAVASLEMLLGASEMNRNEVYQQLGQLHLNVQKLLRLKADMVATINPNPSEPQATIQLREILNSALATFSSKLQTNAVEVDTSQVPSDLYIHCRPARIAQAVGAALSLSIERLDGEPCRIVYLSAASVRGGEVLLSINDGCAKPREEVKAHLYFIRDILKHEGGKLLVSKSTPSEIAFSLRPGVKSPFRTAA